MPQTVADKQTEQKVHQKRLLPEHQKNGQKTDNIECGPIDKEERFFEKDLTDIKDGCGCKFPPSVRSRERVVVVLGICLVLLGLSLIVVGFTSFGSKCNYSTPHKIQNNETSTEVKYTSTATTPPKLSTTVAPPTFVQQSNVTLLPNADPSNPTVYYNLALGKLTNQSSSSSDQSGFVYNSSLAVDGVQDPRFAAKSCSRTEFQTEPFWMVDLGKSIPVKIVHIIRPTDCCENELYNFEIRLSQQADFTNTILCKHYMGLARGAILNITCDDNAVYGRYVRITHLGDEDSGVKSKNRLTLCEVLVFPI